ncbi:thioredoxin family protein [Sulfurimonas sp.]|uniref:thioredoxin family protein n=1 Tax=Sulfurimonas sp. TaxID=2022749 RepID=UPI0025F5D160|nr:thioredoxin family protein [Sulfurimonas sp.]MDD5156720.1 thioredoxin family protein [Sulfurimonas sp.]
MKLFVFLSIFISLVYGAQIDEFAKSVSYSRDYSASIKTAKEQKKMVMLVVVSDYCPWCKKFEHKTLEDSIVKASINKNFTPLVVDKLADKDSFPQEFASKLIPAVYFIDPSSQKSVHEIFAYMKKDEFLQNTEKALNVFKQKQQK